MGSSFLYRAMRKKDMSTIYKVLIPGASHASLPGAKLAFAGHAVKLVWLVREQPATGLSEIAGKRSLLP